MRTRNVVPSRLAYGLAISFLCAVQAQARTHYVHTTSTECFNELNQRIKCPFRWTPAWIVLVSIGIFVGLCAIVIIPLVLIARRRGGGLKAMSMTTSRTTPRSWFFWKKKYSKVADPESSSVNAVPSYEPSDVRYDQAVPTIIEPEQGGVEKFTTPRHSDDSYYVPPELKYSYKASDTGTVTMHSAKSSVTSFPTYEPPMYPPSYEPPAYPPPPTH